MLPRFALRPPCTPKQQVMQLQLTGSWSSEQLRDAMELAMGGCLQLRGLMRQTLLAAAAARGAGGFGDDAMQEE
jgi:hypothetical protein